jgi:hypothetical protein
MTHAEARLVLGLPPSFSDRDVKRAYRRAAAANHPDRGGNVHRMVLVNEAYEVLSSLRSVSTPETQSEPEPEPHQRPSSSSPINPFYRFRQRRHEHPWEKYIVRVSGVVALAGWIAGVVDLINDFPTLRGWIVIGLPLSYLFISVSLRFVVGCGIRIYNLALRIRDRLGAVRDGREQLFPDCS